MMEVFDSSTQLATKWGEWHLATLEKTAIYLWDAGVKVKKYKTCMHWSKVFCCDVDLKLHAPRWWGRHNETETKTRTKTMTFSLYVSKILWRNCDGMIFGLTPLAMCSQSWWHQSGGASWKGNLFFDVSCQQQDVKSEDLWDDTSSYVFSKLMKLAWRRKLKKWRSIHSPVSSNLIIYLMRAKQTRL